MNKLIRNACLIVAALAAQSSMAANPTVEMQTSAGKMTIELYPDKAPKTVANFLQYVKDGFYKDTIFHRVIPGFMIQGGGFSASMAEKPTREGVLNEGKNGLKNERGTLAMARRGDPNSATAQFFINHANNSSLDFPRPDGYGYAVFGKVTQGLDVVDSIASVATGNHPAGFQNVPVTPIVIQSITLNK
jgi:peptidyl-prolyl cis-trans isomerase A (cyclophilin A)